MHAQTDTALVAQTLNGHHEAFSQLVRKHQNRAYGTAVGILSDFELAQDVVQEAFITAYCDLAKLKDPERFDAWLRGIVRFTAHGIIRDLQRIRKLVETAQHTETFAPTALPDHHIETHETHQMVRMALEQLNNKNREILSLYYISNLSYKDIANLLTITETAVKGRIQRARDQLREEWHMVEKHLANEGLPEDFSEEIQRLLNFGDGSKRRQNKAIESLQEIGTPAVDTLIEALNDRRQRVRHIAACGLCAIGDARALNPLLDLLRRNAWISYMRDREKILNIPGARDAMLDIVRQKNYWTHYHPNNPLDALAGAHDDLEAFDVVYQLFKQPAQTPVERNVQIRCLYTLVRMQPDRALGVILEAINSGNNRLLDHGIRLSDRHNSQLPIDVCEHIMKTAPLWTNRRKAAHMLIDYGESGIQKLEEIMNAGTPADRVLATLILARHGSESARNMLKTDLSDDPELLNRINGYHLINRFPNRLRQLARTNHSQIGPLVEGFVYSAPPVLRRSAIKIFAKQKGAEILPILRTMLSETKHRQSKVAREAFWRIYKLRDEALPTVQDMFTSDNWLERKAAVCLLRRWGKLTVDQKHQAENDTHVAVRNAATPRT